MRPSSGGAGDPDDDDDPPHRDVGKRGGDRSSSRGGEGRGASLDYQSEEDRRPRCRLAAMEPPTFTEGDDWPCFKQDFQETVEMAGLGPPQQLAYLKKALPEEARRVLLQSHIRTIDAAWQVLEELYDPPKDTSLLLAAIEAITQEPGEKFRVLAGRIEAAVARYGEEVTVGLLDQAKLVRGRFIRAVRDQETRHMLMWARDRMTLNEMIRKGQEMADLKGPEAKTKKAMRVQDPEQHVPRDDEPGVVRAARQVNQAEEMQSKILTQMADIQRQLTSLQRQVSEQKQGQGQKQGKKQPNRGTRPRGRSIVCYNCGEPNHKRDTCPREQIGNGFTYCPAKQPFSSRGGGDSQRTTPSRPAPGAGEA